MLGFDVVWEELFNDRSSIGLRSVMEKMVAVEILGLWDGF